MQANQASPRTTDKQHEADGLPTVSIVIKALDEEAKIARCIESAISALKEIPNLSEIILVDSVSSDDTVKIAQRYPITIVQFESVDERGCGAAVQLGYQCSRGDFVMLLDGDMELLPGFLPTALAKLTTEPGLAGVAGLIEDTAINNSFDWHRVANGAISAPIRPARSLDGGGLYRRRAIAEAGGYAADRNLKAWEEAELGMRLTSAGWTLERIDFRAIRHTGHAAGTGELLRSRWRSRRAMSNGVLMRQAAGKPWMFKAFLLMRHPLLVIVLWAGALGALGLSFATSQWDWLAGYALVVFLLLLLLAVQKKSLRRALTSFSLWHYMAAALMLGLREKVVSPTEPIRSLNLSSPLDG